MVSVILLAAGLSERFGSPKALALINGQPLIERLLKILLQTSIEEIIIVLGAHTNEIQPCIFKHIKITSVYNKHHKFGQTSSVQTGLNCLSSHTKAFFILPVDFPFVLPTTFQSIIEEHLKQNTGIIIPQYQSRRGHPPLFDIQYKNQILKLSQNQGLNTILHENPSHVYPIEVNDPGVLQTFNTPEEFQNIIKDRFFI